MKEFAIVFACWLAYAVCKKQGWIDPGLDAPAWAVWLIYGFLALLALGWAAVLLWTWRTKPRGKAAK